MSNNVKRHTWKEVREELFTQEEIRESDLRVELIGTIIEARHEKGISQKKLGEYIEEILE